MRVRSTTVLFAVSSLPLVLGCGGLGKRSDRSREHRQGSDIACRGPSSVRIFIYFACYADM